jgi:ankyrin repeat protein
LQIVLNNNKIEYFELVNFLLDNCANIEAETSLKRTPLHIAVIKNNYEIANLLLNCGANIDCFDIDNHTPVHFASQLGYEKILFSLLQKKCRLDILNTYGQTPFDLVGNYKIYMIFNNFFSKNIRNLKTGYSRVLHNNHMLHNNRVDQIKKILYLSNNLMNKKQDSKNNVNFKKENLTLESFNIIELIGKGSFGEVYLVELEMNKQKYAMKIIDKKRILSQNIVRYIMTEKNVLSTIDHPFIVKLCFSIQTDDFLYLILEYCPK